MDMGFVKKIGKDPKRDAIVISIIDMAHRMGMKVVAEGIENKQQSEFLCNHGCDYLQGYFYSKPIPDRDFLELLRRENAQYYAERFSKNELSDIITT